MAIGSEGEIGTTFTVWGKMSQEDRDAWFKHMNENWVPLQKGYATLVLKKENNPFYESKETRELREMKSLYNSAVAEIQRLSQIAKY
jgi:hypothetical protein